MKKMLAMTLALMMALSMTACGGEKSVETSEAPAETTVAASEETAEAPATDVIKTAYGDLPADGPELNLVLASDATEGAIHSLAVKHLQEIIEKETQGKIKITYYPNAQLGSDTEILNSCIAGDIDMDLMSGALLQSMVPESCLFNVPFLNQASDLEAIIKTMTDGAFRDAFDACYEEAGLKLMVLSLGQSFEVNTKNPVRSIEDLKGLKIRTVQGESYMAVYSALGANPTPMAYSEVYTALQQGVVDGHDQMLGNILNVKFYEQAPYIMMTDHNFGSFTIVMNKAKFDGLPAAYQVFMENICDYMSDYLTRAFVDGTASNRADLEALGVEFYDLSDEERAAMIDECADAIASVEKMVQNDELIALYKTTLESNK